MRGTGNEIKLTLYVARPGRMTKATCLWRILFHGLVVDEIVGRHPRNKEQDDVPRLKHEWQNNRGMERG